MLPIYIGAPGEEKQGLCTGSENYWCVNSKASPEDIKATLDFMLRIYQQYFLVSCAAQLILGDLAAAGRTLRELPDAVAIQINDTHPSMIIPELVRRLMAQGIPFDEAADLVTRTCAYTNHTILAEALEKWPLADLATAVPALVPVITALAKRAAERHPAPQLAIIDEQQRVHMGNFAHLLKKTEHSLGL